MFNCPYSNAKFPEYAEDIPEGLTAQAMSGAAKRLGIYIIAGSIPERDSKGIYNTCLSFNREGEIIGKHRKAHLFDINVPGKITFRESDTLTPGDSATVFDTEFLRIGTAICYDIRFPELSRLMVQKGAKVIILPGAFNMTTGPAHWELLVRTRALDNQVYFAAASPARDESAAYIAYGNSMVAGPWGDVISRAGYAEEIIYAHIDPGRLDRVREELPLLKHRRLDIYDLIEK
jgi:predicted amidohydrolase